MAHVKSIHYNIARTLPDVGRMAPMPEDTELVNVYNFKVSNSTAFMECIKEITSTIKKAEGDTRGTWYAVQGGAPEVADYFVAAPFKNFADLDADRDGVWQIYEKAHGKSKTDALRAKFRSSLSSDWSYMYTLNKGLSN